jgi:glutamyl-Q tRNA(Asp) synthetase
MSVAGPPQDAKAPSGGSAEASASSVGALYIGRFAPSPTGPLHAGSLVAALASWLDARAHGGRWLVRIEDVDTARCVPGAGPLILDQLAALGLRPDEAPLQQSTRGAFYQAALDRLVAQGLAYPCACSRGDIAMALNLQGRPHQRHGELAYPGTCRAGLGGRAPRAWRFKVPPGTVSWHDRRLGVRQQDVESDVGDFVLKRADRLWAYQLAVVVDDAQQGVTDVVRGEDLADNTARQILLQRALGVATPGYLHTPLVLASNGEKLSKQNGAEALDTSDPLRALNAAAQLLGLPQQPAPLADALAAWQAQWRAACAREPLLQSRE